MSHKLLSRFVVQRNKRGELNIQAEIVSLMHMVGWYTVHRICVHAQVVHLSLLNATRTRHRISTLHAGLEVPEADQMQFYKHMSHSAEINSNIYQSPLAEAAILKVGSQLIRMDGGLLSDNRISSSLSAAKLNMT